MNEQDMEEIGHKVVRLEEKFTNHATELSEIKGVAKDLLETSRYQSHAIDQILKELEADRVSKARVHDLEVEIKSLRTATDKLEVRVTKEEASTTETNLTFAQARFAWKVAYGILTTPVLGYIGYKAFELIQSLPK